MRVHDLIQLLPTQYTRASRRNPLRVGHNVPELGYWTKEEGFVKKQDLSYTQNPGESDEWVETLSFPIIAVIDEKIGNNDLTLTITAKTAKHKRTDTKEQEDKTLKVDIYEADSTITGTLEIPRFTTPNATFLVTSLGNKCYGIKSISDNLNYDSGKITFYGLASNGSKIIYWWSMYRLAEDLKRLMRPWIAPAKCSRCDGTGIEPNTVANNCKQCKGYGYSGYTSIKYGQKQIGKDVGVGRGILDNDWDQLTDEEHDQVWKFINKAWTQKWWVTPTKKEIKRLFSHFYMVEDDDIIIEERFHMQEPVWSLYLPGDAKMGSPFSALSESDKDLMRYIAKSITPAGVSVFVGFYVSGLLGDLDSVETSNIYERWFRSSIEDDYSSWSVRRWDFWNGWTEAIDDFENGIDPMWTEHGNVGILNVNDQNRHMCEFRDTSSLTYSSGIWEDSGTIEIWAHPQDNDLYFGIQSDDGHEFGIRFCDDSGGFLQYCEETTENIRSAYPHSDFHLRVKWEDSGNLIKTYINRELKGSGNATFGTNFEVVVGTEGEGNGYVDAYGDSWSDPNYEINDNWQRLYPMGVGLNNNDDLSGIDNLHDRYFRRDRPILID